jgi:hypothetical protein
MPSRSARYSSSVLEETTQSGRPQVRVKVSFTTWCCSCTPGKERKNSAFRNVNGAIIAAMPRLRLAATESANAGDLTSDLPAYLTSSRMPRKS